MAERVYLTVAEVIAIHHHQIEEYGGEHGLLNQGALEAAVFRRLVEHLRARTDVQNIDLMNLAGFCRNCLSNWMKEEADGKGVAISKDESREAVYGMPYETWKAKFQGTASPEQVEAMKKSHSGH